jgi:hypothetical protein
MVKKPKHFTVFTGKNGNKVFIGKNATYLTGQNRKKRF